MKRHYILIVLLVLMVGYSPEPITTSVVPPTSTATPAPIPATAMFTPSPLPPTGTPLPPTLTSTPEPYPLPDPADVSGEVTLWHAYTSAATGEFLAGLEYPNLINKPVQIPFGEIFTRFRNEASIRSQSREFDNYWGPFGEMFISVPKDGAPVKSAVTTACSKLNQANGK